MYKNIIFLIKFFYKMLQLFIQTIIKKPFAFKGRSSRLEFFSFTFFSQIIFLLLYFVFRYQPYLLSKIEKLLSLKEPLSISLFYISIPFFMILLIVLYLLIGISLTSRRLHDCNVSGVWSLLCFNGGFSPLFFIKGTSGANRYGEEPPN